MWKAFDEMERARLDRRPRAPKMISRPGRGLRADRARLRAPARATPSRGRTPHTVASGLRVPSAIGDYLILDAIRASGGTALTVSDDAMIADMQALAREEGISAAPEGAATLAGASALLRAQGVLGP